MAVGCEEPEVALAKWDIERFQLHSQLELIASRMCHVHSKISKSSQFVIA